jgi:hypothetical protein
MKIRTTIPVMSLLITTTLTWDVYSLLRFPATGPMNHHVALRSDLTDGHLRLRRVSLRCATRTDLRMEVAKADVIKASRHPRFRPVGVEHYLLAGTTQRPRNFL